MNDWYIAQLAPNGAQIGEFLQVESWQTTDTLNEDGSFSLTLPLTAQAVAQIGNGLPSNPLAIIGIYVRFDDGFECVGGGYTKKSKPDFEARKLTISGEGWLSPLARTFIMNGEISDLVAVDSTTDRGFNNHRSDGGGGFDTFYPQDNLPYSFAWTSPATNLEYIYIGDYVPFDNWTVTLSQANTNGANLIGEYFRVSADGNALWEILSFTDGTAVASKTMAQNGTISWTKPSEWGLSSHDGKERFWIRFFVDANLTEITMTANTQRVKGKSQTDISDLSGYFPSGWSLATSSEQGTLSGSYWPRIHGVSVLRQAVSMVERASEFFRAGDGSTTDPRRLDWFRLGERTCEMIAMNASPAGLISAENRAYIEKLDYEIDYTDVIDELYVEGAGQGVAALTLALSTDVYIGKFVYPAQSLVTNLTVEESMSDFRKFNSIRSESGLPTEDAANELLRAAISHLNQRVLPETSLSMKLRGLSHRLRAGDKFKIDYAYYHDDELVYALSGDVFAESVTWSSDGGVVVCDVKASSAPRSITSDKFIQQIESAASYIRDVQPLDSSDIRRLGRTA